MGLIMSDSNITSASKEKVTKAKWTLDLVTLEAKKYSSRLAFQMGSSGAYYRALHSGWLESVCSHMPLYKARSKRLNFEAVKAEAKRYQSRYAFMQGNSSAYYKAIKSGWLDAVCSHMPAYVAKARKWDFDAVKVEAQKYKTRTEFQNGCKGAYQRALKMSWIDAVCSHMPKHAGEVWDLASVKAAAAKFDTLTKFQKGAPGAYSMALKSGWIGDVCSHMPKRAHTASIWTLDAVKAESQKYSTRREFRLGSNAAYQKAVRKNWLDSVCSHMVVQSSTSLLTKDFILSEARKFQTRNEFFKGAASSYIRAKELGIFDEATEHMQAVFTYWTEDLVLAEAAKYSTTVEFLANCSKGYWAAQRHGLLDKVRSLYGRERITKEKCLAVAAQFKNRKEFEKAAHNYLSYASYHGFLDEACQHMQPLRINWTPESVKVKAAEYGSLKEFRRQCKKGYAYAKKHRLLETLQFSDVMPGQQP